MDEPRYDVKVELVGQDDNAFAIMGRVARALRTQVGRGAADAYTQAAMASQSYDELLQLTMRTVHVL